MREIKVRAYDKLNKRFIYVSFHPTHIAWASPEYADQSLLCRDEDSAPEGVGFLNIEGWQQCTGIKDRNGVHIYEGDILKHEYMGNYECVWVFCGFDFKQGEHYLHNEPFGCEIIGNIYSNPELLTD